MRRKGVWLTILVVGCFSSVFAQRGIQEFTSSGTFQVPTGVSTLRVDAYGAGGGGGGGSPTACGGGGGGGAYAGGVITVSPGAVLTIVIGKGGARGLAGDPAGAGSAGGASRILTSSGVVVFSASGGQGGHGASGSTGGSGGTGGARGKFGSISHAGQNGTAGDSMDVGMGGAGYVPVGFSVVSAVGFGAGSFGGFEEENGTNGVPGYILISW